MAASETPPTPGFLRTLLREEARLLPLLAGVFRLDADVYREIAKSPHAIPAAFAIVITTSLLWGIGQSSLALLFLWTAGAVAAWGITTALIWAVGALWFPERADYTRLLRCLGFAFAWNVLQIGSGLPGIGWLIQWAALVLWGGSMVLAAREVLDVSTGQAAAVCAGGLAVLFLLVFAGAG